MFANNYSDMLLLEITLTFSLFLYICEVFLMIHVICSKQFAFDWEPADEEGKT